MPLASAIQTFLCGGSRLPFGSGIASLAVVLGTYTCRHDYWHCVIPLDCKFRGMSLCAWPGLSWCPPFASLVSDMLAAPLLEVSFSLSVFRVCPTLAVMLLLFGAVCSVSLVLAQFGRTLVWTGQGYFFATLQYMRWAPSWIKLKPEDLQKQVGKLAEKYDALVVVVNVEGRLRCATGKVGHWHQVPAYPQEGGLRSAIPEVCTSS